jgi:hypothetical protein
MISQGTPSPQPETEAENENNDILDLMESLFPFKIPVVMIYGLIIIVLLSIGTSIVFKLAKRKKNKNKNS